MSQAFIREGDDMWLNEVPPTVQALSHFLTKQNNGIRIQLIKSTVATSGEEIFWMSDGLKYKKNDKNEWEVTEG